MLKFSICLVVILFLRSILFLRNFEDGEEVCFSLYFLIFDDNFYGDWDFLFG